MTKERLECERLIYDVMNTLDDSKKRGESANAEFFAKIFAKMSDKEFEEYITKPFSLYYQTQGLNYEPSMDSILKGLDIINIPLLESIYEPYKYKNIDGKPIKTKKCMVCYIHMKRMKQLLTKKNGMSIAANTRDIRTGLLTGVDKNGKESDREFESLAISGLYETMKEFSRSRGASMDDKSAMDAHIKTYGQVRLSDLPNDPSDDLAKNLISTYFIGAQLNTNIVNVDYMTPYTLKTKKMRMSRQD